MMYLRLLNTMYTIFLIQLAGECCCSGGWGTGEREFFSQDVIVIESFSSDVIVKNSPTLLTQTPHW